MVVVVVSLYISQVERERENGVERECGSRLLWGKWIGRKSGCLYDPLCAPREYFGSGRGKGKITSRWVMGGWVGGISQPCGN